MAEAPLTPHLQALLFQHRLALRRERMAPRQAPTLTTEAFDAPPEPVMPAQPSLAKPPMGLTPDYKGSELAEKRYATNAGLEQERMQQSGAMDRAKLNALTEIEQLRFKILAKKAGGGYEGKWQAFLKATADEANAPENSASREVFGGIKRAIYQGLPGMYRGRAEASGIGFGAQAKGPAGSDIKLSAEAKEAEKKQAGAEKVAHIGAAGREATANKRLQTTRDIAAGHIATGEKPADTMVRQAMGGKDVRALEAERIRAGGTTTAAAPPEGFELARQKSTGKMVWLNRATGEVREPE